MKATKGKQPPRLTNDQKLSIYRDERAKLMAAINKRPLGLSNAQKLMIDIEKHPDLVKKQPDWIKILTVSDDQKCQIYLEEKAERIRTAEAYRELRARRKEQRRTRQEEDRL